MKTIKSATIDKSEDGLKKRNTSNSVGILHIEFQGDVNFNYYASLSDQELKVCCGRGETEALYHILLNRYPEVIEGAARSVAPQNSSLANELQSDLLEWCIGNQQLLAKLSKAGSIKDYLFICLRNRATKYKSMILRRASKECELGTAQFPSNEEDGFDISKSAVERLLDETTPEERDEAYRRAIPDKTKRTMFLWKVGHPGHRHEEMLAEVSSILGHPVLISAANSRKIVERAIPKVQAELNKLIATTKVA